MAFFAFKPFYGVSANADGYPSAQRALECLNDSDVGDAAAFTHGLQSPFFAASMQCVNEGCHQLCTCGAQWVTKRDCAAIDVQLVWVSTCVL